MNQIEYHYRAYIKHLKLEHPVLWEKNRHLFDEWLPKPPRYS